MEYVVIYLAWGRLEYRYRDRHGEAYTRETALAEARMLAERFPAVRVAELRYVAKWEPYDLNGCQARYTQPMLPGMEDV